MPAASSQALPDKLRPSRPTLKRAELREAILEEHAVGRPPPLPREPVVLARAEVEVKLHVYHVARLVKFTGLPIYHLGVEVHGYELYFAVSGIAWCRPGGYDPRIHKEVILLGKTRQTEAELWATVYELQKEWPGSAYNLLGPNCQTFACTLVPLLIPGCSVPPQFSRFSGRPKAKELEPPPPMGPFERARLAGAQQGRPGGAVRAGR